MGRYYCSTCGATIGTTNFGGDRAGTCSGCASRKSSSSGGSSKPSSGGGGFELTTLLIVLAKFIGIPVAIFVLTFVVMQFFGWSERVFDPVRGWFGNMFGDNFAMTAAYETDDYFRKNGVRVDYLWEDIDAVAVKAQTIDAYKIRITEFIADPHYGEMKRRFPSWKQPRSTVTSNRSFSSRPCI